MSTCGPHHAHGGQRTAPPATSGFGHRGWLHTSLPLGLERILLKCPQITKVTCNCLSKECAARVHRLANTRNARSHVVFEGYTHPLNHRRHSTMCPMLLPWVVSSQRKMELEPSRKTIPHSLCLTTYFTDAKTKLIFKF